MRKKILALVMAATMVFGMATTVMAAPSAQAGTTVSAAKDADGNAVSVTVATTTKAPAASEIASNETVTKVVDLSVPAGTKFPVTLTFSAAGVTSSTTGYLLHWNGSAWEKISCKFGNGTVTATFTSLSPVAVVTTKGTAAGSTSAAGTTSSTGSTSSSTSSTASPKTGETSSAMIAAFAAMAALGCAVVVRRKRA